MALCDPDPHPPLPVTLELCDPLKYLSHSERQLRLKQGTPPPTCMLAGEFLFIHSVCIELRSVRLWIRFPIPHSSIYAHWINRGVSWGGSPVPLPNSLWDLGSPMNPSESVFSPLYIGYNNSSLGVI